MNQSSDLFKVPELLPFKQEDEPDDNPLVPAQPPFTSYQTTDLTFSCGLLNTPTCRVKLTVDAGPGCGGIAWPAGCVLSNYLTTRKSLRGLTVLELGSGTGLVGIVAGLLGAASVWVTDQEPLLALMQTNIVLNRLSNVHALQLDWGSPLPQDVPDEPDLILAADCVYFEPAFPLLVSTLSSLATSRNTEILFCYKKRRKADKRFFTLLKKEFNWEDVTDDPRREEYTREGIYLYHLLKR